MKRLLGSVAVAVGLLAGSAAEVRADGGIGIGVGVSISCSKGKGQCGQCPQAYPACMLPPCPQMCCPPLCGAPMPGCCPGWGGNGAADAARAAEATAAAAMWGARCVIGF